MRSEGPTPKSLDANRLDWNFGPSGAVPNPWGPTVESDKAVTVVDKDGVASTFEVTRGARVYAEGATHKSQILASSGRKTTMGVYTDVTPT
jgi:hypothetical protein